MKKSRKLMILLITVLVIAMIPGTAFAKKAKKKAKGGKWYVPTAGTEYEWDKNKCEWVPTQRTFSATFDKQGRVKSVTRVTTDKDTGAPRGVYSYTYSWKGDFVKRKAGSTTETYSNGEVYTSTYETKIKYKAKKPSKETHTSASTWKGNPNSASSSTAKYRWGKKDGSVATSSTSTSYKTDGTSTTSTDREAEIITLKKGRLGSEWVNNATYQYYQNGNLKKVTTIRNSGKDYEVSEYNKAGFLVKDTSVWVETEWDENDNRIEKTYSSVTTYNWTMNGKKPVSVEWSSIDQDGKITDPKLWSFSSVKKVKQSRNCDAFGSQVWLQP